jgi:thioredoxin reductase
MSVWPLAIVGAGPAGIAAAAEAARLGVRPLLLDATGRPGGTIRIAHEVRNIPFLGDAVGGEIVVEHLAAFLSRWDASVGQARIVRLFEASDDFALETEEGARFVASRVVLALGTHPLYPDIEGLSPGGHFVGSAPDACANGIPRRAVVIGGSDVALDQARWLRTRGARVEVLARGEVRAPTWLIDAAERDGVVIRRQSRVLRAKVQGDQIALTLRCKDETSDQVVDAVVSAIGRKPVFMEGAPAAIRAHPGRIRVVGDGTGRRARHVVAALGDGCVAAAELLARPAGEMR